VLVTASWALVVGTVALVVVTWLYVRKTQKLVESSERAAKAAEASAKAAEESVAAMEEQIDLQKEELIYCYEPGLALQIHEEFRWPDGTEFLVKVFPASQASVFAVNIAWEDAQGPTRDMRPACEAESGTVHNQLRGEGGPGGTWTSARVAPGEVWWCLLDQRVPGASLVVAWRHVGKRHWRHRWTLTRNDLGQHGLMPEGTPEREA